jgi:hypothetical protein
VRIAPGTGEFDPDVVPAEVGVVAGMSVSVLVGRIVSKA